MEVEFVDNDLDKMETDAKFTGGYGEAVVRGFRKCMFVIRSAVDERDLYSMRSLNFEQLKGSRKHQHSVRINKQWRLILELKRVGPEKTVVVISIEDYH